MPSKKLACPVCGASGYSSTYVGYIGRDENDITCICGWKGKGYELKEVNPANPPGETTNNKKGD